MRCFGSSKCIVTVYDGLICIRVIDRITELDPCMIDRKRCQISYLTLYLSSSARPGSPARAR
jgi:hypothetical protein